MKSDTPNRLIMCKNCVAPIDTLMDEYYISKHDNSICYCVNCGPKFCVGRALSPAAKSNTIAVQFRTEQDELAVAPKGQTFVCLHCGRENKAKATLKFLCDNEAFKPQLVYSYSLVFDEKQLVVNFIPVSWRDN